MPGVAEEATASAYRCSTRMRHVQAGQWLAGTTPPRKSLSAGLRGDVGYTWP
jgi:hypothetical protein